MPMLHEFRNGDVVEATHSWPSAKPEIGAVVQAAENDKFVEVYFKDKMKAEWFGYDQLTLIKKGANRLDEETRQESFVTRGEN